MLVIRPITLVLTLAVCADSTCPLAKMADCDVAPGVAIVTVTGFSLDAIFFLSA
jgi:hypothetical protein